MEENEKNGCNCSCNSCSGCGHDEHEESGFEDGIITFTDEEGKDVEFQILDVVSLNGKEYLVVIPCDDEDDTGVVILEIKQEDGEEVYDTVTDDSEAEEVFQEFKKLNEIEE